MEEFHDSASIYIPGQDTGSGSRASVVTQVGLLDILVVQRQPSMIEGFPSFLVQAVLTT